MERERRGRPSRAKEGGRNRVQIDFTEVEMQYLDSLIRLSGLSTRNDIVRNAINTYGWLLNKVLQDRDLNISAEDLRAILRIPQKLENRETGNTPHPQS